MRNTAKAGLLALAASSLPFAGAANAEDAQLTTISSATVAEPVVCVEGQKAQISTAEQQRRGLLEVRDVEATPGYPMQYYSNARGHSTWWSDQCGNDDTLMVSVKLPANPPPGAEEGVHGFLVDYVLNEEKFGNVEFFYENTDRDVGMLRVAFEGQQSDICFFKEASSCLAEGVALARSDMAIEGKSIRELEQLASLNLD